MRISVRMAAVLGAAAAWAMAGALAPAARGAQPSPAPAADASKVYTEEEAWRIGWPFMNGPCGNFLPLRTGVRIADDLLQARLVWESEDRDFGSAKTGSQTFRSAADILRRLGPHAEVRPGNWAGVIVAEGKVFASSWRPAGPFREAEVGEGKADAVKFRLDAEDLLIALDARTGKGVWKAVEPGGLVLGGGKRGGFQVAPAYWRGKVFSMGSTGRLFAYDAATGRRLWQSDVGPAHQAVAKRREEVLAAAAKGRWTDPDGPGWHTSLVVADGVLIAPMFSGPGGGRDTNLRGIDVESGETRWEVASAVSKWATPNVWRHGGREYLLCATLGGALHLVDPRDGKELWKVTGLGPNYFTLAPSPTHVLVNVAPSDPAAKREPGYYGAYRISPTGAELAWKMPQEPRNQIPTWFDSCAHQRYLIRDGLVYVATEGTKEAPGRFLILKETTGEVLAEHVNRGSDNDQVGGLFYLVEDRLLCRVDSVHGPTHGGRHPIVQWAAAPGKVSRYDHEGGLSGLDLAEFASAYEVLMEVPVVAGRMFERTGDGGLVCYDVRQPTNLTTWALDFDGGYIGMPPLPVRLWTQPDGAVYGGKAYPPTDRHAGLAYGQCRRFARWERVALIDAEVAGDRLTAALKVGFGSHVWPVQVDLARSGDQATGTWTRRIAGLEKPVATGGAVTGRGPSRDRVYPTPWLADRPWTSFGTNPDGTATWVLQLADAITLGRSPAGLTLCFDHDGNRVVRAGATAFGFSQAWHEVEAGQLRVQNGRITGHVMVVLNGDWWVAPNPATRTGIAGRIEIEAAADKESVTGSYKAEFGIPWTASGPVRGTVRQEP